MGRKYYSVREQRRMLRRLCCLDNHNWANLQHSLYVVAPRRMVLIPSPHVMKITSAASRFFAVNGVSFPPPMLAMNTMRTVPLGYKSASSLPGIFAMRDSSTAHARSMA